MNQKHVRILITGPPISAKTNLGNVLEEVLRPNGDVVNHDVDYTEGWEDSYPGRNCDFYLLQTPHGAECEKEDKINPNDFDFVAYTYPRLRTAVTLLTNRGLAWFREGVPVLPYEGERKLYSPRLIIPITKNLADSFKGRQGWFKEDINYFNNKGLPLFVIEPYLVKDKLFFRGIYSLVKKILQKQNEVH